MDELSPFLGVDQLDLRVYSDDEIEKISVMQVTSEEAINQIGHCCRGGLYDQRMGVMMNVSGDKCETCLQNAEKCMGHCGHINLPVPIFNPIFSGHIFKLLRMLCLGCGKMQVEQCYVLQLQCQLKLLSRGYSHEALTVYKVLLEVFEQLSIKIDAEGKEEKGNRNSPSSLALLQAKLDSYSEGLFEEDVENNIGERPHTSNVRSVRNECLKEFFSHVKIKDCCQFCSYPMFTAIYRDSQMFLSMRKASLAEKFAQKEIELPNRGILDLDLGKKSIITPLQVRDLLRHSWKEERQALSQVFAIFQNSELKYPTDILFMFKLLVIPPKYRPLVKMRESFIEHDSCVLLKTVLRLCRSMSVLVQLLHDPEMKIAPALRVIINDIPGSDDKKRADKVWQLLQCSVDNMLDASARSEINSVAKGIKQVIEKKEGLFRSNLMGKRVNFSARSVLAPDPAIATDEVGVPLDFARHLHFPVEVTPWNVSFLRKLVINGPHTYPGAHMIEAEDGRITHLRNFDLEQRTAFAKKLLTPPDSTSVSTRPCKVVYRQLMDGDLVLMNRQPTLHRLSIQAHKSRVMKGVRVLRMPYANCKAYNADFDGDEMNLHFPQNLLAQSECQSLVTTHNQYLTPKDGAPLAGLVQDCVVAGVTLSVRGSIFEREDYIQLVNVAMQDFNFPIKIQPPAIMKPKQFWTGKQIISTIIQNIVPKKEALPTFKFKTSVKPEIFQEDPPRSPKGGERWGKFNPNEMTETEFIIREGELVCGVVDKSAIGSTSYGLVHVCYDLYGGAVASQLLTAFNRLCMNYLQWHGHTISCKEFLTPYSVAKKRRDQLANLVKTAPLKVLEKLEMTEDQFRKFWETNHVTNCEKNTALIDGAYTQALGGTTSSVTTENERGLYRRTIDNRMRLMVDSGAKGSKVNMNQMASLFGPTALDGKRMPLSLAGKSLPSFDRYDLNPRAGGYISSRFMTGMDPQSYFFLCIVGRDSLQHTAVKTANSGYMQRCLIKHLEGIEVSYDMTVRNSDGLVLQFEYGEDGLDVTKAPFLKNSQTLDVVVDNCIRQLSDSQMESVQAKLNKSRIQKKTKKIRKLLKKQGKRNASNRKSAFTLFCDEQLADKTNTCFQFGDRINEKSGRSEKTLLLVEEWKHLSSDKRSEYDVKFRNMQPPLPDPVLSEYCSHSNVGVVSEALDYIIDSYYSDHYSMRDLHHQLYDKSQIETTVAIKARSSHVDPGEAVGAICAQAIGEPLTQMTLNTFHFAGRDELNVTLGVPRMVEILRTATANISTPIMEIPFKSNVTKSQAEVLKKMFTEVTLKQVMHSMEAFVMEIDPQHQRLQNYHRVKLRFQLLPTSHYKQELPVTSKDALRFLEKYFFLKGIIKRLQATTAKVPEICSTMEGLRAKEPKIKKEGNGEEEREMSDSESLPGDDNQDIDLSDKARQNRQNEEDYDDEEEEEEDDDDDDNDNDEGEEDYDERKLKREENSDEAEDVDDLPIDGAAGGIWKRKKSKLSSYEVNTRITAVKALSTTVLDYKFDTVNEEWCELTLSIGNRGYKYDFKSIVSDAAAVAYVHKINGIKRAFVEEKDGSFMLRTEGVNIYKLVEWSHMLDINKLYTNDVQLVARTLGIEAAQRSIIREIRAVQSAYNIEVNYRHLTLLADYFTADGNYKACNRGALSSCQSIMQQMSYESCMHFLKQALVNDAPDRMQSPSARIATGQVVKVGTNIMDILVDVSRCLA